MEWGAFAIVTITLDRKKLAEEEVQMVENQLRVYEQIDHFEVKDKKIIFYLWGRDSVDYSMLDKIKGQLKKMQLGDFVISAIEYVKQGRKYYEVVKNNVK